MSLYSDQGQATTRLGRHGPVTISNRGKFSLWTVLPAIIGWSMVPLRIRHTVDGLLARAAERPGVAGIQGLLTIACKCAVICVARETKRPRLFFNKRWLFDVAVRGCIGINKGSGNTWIYSGAWHSLEEVPCVLGGPYLWRGDVVEYLQALADSFRWFRGWRRSRWGIASGCGWRWRRAGRWWRT